MWRRRCDGVDAVCHQAAMVGLGVDLHDIDDYVSHNDLGTAVLLRALARGRGSAGRLVLASSMVVYGEGAYRCAEHGRGARRCRALRGDLAAGRFEPRCPRCGGELTPSRSTRAPARSPQRVRGHQGPPGAPVLRLRPRDRRRGDRAALPQRVRAADAARHAVRRRRGDLRQRAGRRPCAAGVRGRPASCAISSTCATSPAPT